MAASEQHRVHAAEHNNRLRPWLSAACAGMLLAFGSSPVLADWKSVTPKLTVAIIGENENRIGALAPHLAKDLGVPVETYKKTTYPAVIDGIVKREVQLAMVGAAQYARIWLSSGGAIEPLAAITDELGDFGYHSVLIVKADSAFKSIDDLKGRHLGFVDKDSTSGHVAPRFFLKEAGFDVDRFFGKVSFLGEHEATALAVVAGTVDAGAVWWTSEKTSVLMDLEKEKRMKVADVRIIWTSPLLPDEVWVVPTALPIDLRRLLLSKVMRLQQEAPQVWKDFSEGSVAGMRQVTHADYEAVVRMVKATAP